MPALTMRGRYLMREYWSDSDLFRRLTAEERERLKPFLDAMGEDPGAMDVLDPETGELRRKSDEDTQEGA